MLDLKAEQIEELKKFHKSYFDVGSILSTASELKYMGELKSAISREFAAPSPDFVKFFGKQVYEGQFTQKVLDQFTTLVKRTISNYINDMISDRLKAAIKDNSSQESENAISAEVEPITEQEEKSASKIVTTEMELEAYYIVKAILRGTIAAERVTYRDAQSYFAVFIDDNNRKPVCRLYLDSDNNKKISFIDESKKEHHNKISCIDDIYQFADEIIAAASRFV